MSQKHQKDILKTYLRENLKYTSKPSLTYIMSWILDFVLSELLIIRRRHYVIH